MLKLIAFVLLLLNATTLLATTFSLKPGWNSLGTLAEIPTSQILAFPAVKNVVIFDSAVMAYKSTNNNQFNIVPAKSGFFVFSDDTVTIDISTVDSSVVVAKLDGNGAELPSDAIQWDILHIKDAGLYVEMKNDFTNGQEFVYSDATDYCTNLLVGSIGGWRLPTNAELTGIGTIFFNPAYSDYFTTSLGTVDHWNDIGTHVLSFGIFGTLFHLATANQSSPNGVFCVQDAP